MKTIKHHLVNWETGKTFCGIDFNKDSIRIAELETDGKWYNDFGNELDTVNNWDSILCMNCLKLHDSYLIDQFKFATFLVKYELAIPKSNRAKKKKNCRTRANRIAGIKTESITDKLNKKSNPIPKSDKGIAREKHKAELKAKQAIESKKKTKKESKPKVKSNSPTESKCKIINKPKPIEEKKTLLNPGDTIKTEEVIQLEDEFRIGDPVENDVIELGVNSNWKLVRHDKHLDLWKLQHKIRNKKTKKLNWIDDSEFCPYKFISDIVNMGYCNS